MLLRFVGPAVSDASFAAIAGGLLILLQVVVVRILDFYFPKGRMSKRAEKYSVDIPDEEDEKG